jgi:AraC family transcriptional regulator, positive regulator of tynA and feaB
MAIVFSTRDVDPRERLSYWRETAGAREVELSADPAFVATLRNQSLDHVRLAELDCEPCQIQRTARNIARAGCDHFFLTMQLGGSAVISHNDRLAVSGMGSLVLLDTRHPYTINFQGRARSVSLVIPRRAFEERLGGVAALSGRTMEAGRPLTGIASGFLSMLPTRIEAVDGAVAARLAEQTLDLIALAFSIESGQAVTLSCARTSALFRLKAAIEAQLCKPVLKPEMAAGAAGISVRYANDLLKREGFSLERFIVHRRLERCRRAFEDPGQRHRTIGEIAFAWGFADLSHFVRRFRAEYGCTPGDYRRRGREGVSSS